MNIKADDALQLLGFVRCFAFYMVGIDVGRRKPSSAEFRVQSQASIIGELLTILSEVQEFVFCQVLVFGHLFSAEIA
jgi:hypothetical protein